MPSALGTLRTAGAVETACCERSAGSQPEAWSPLPWGLGCPAVGGCLHKRGLSPSCVHRWTDTWTRTDGQTHGRTQQVLLHRPSVETKTPHRRLSVWEPPQDRVGSV